MLNTLFIFMGAGVGGLFRYWISTLTYSFLGKSFPFGTLVVNISGCLLMGFLFILLVEKFDGLGPQLRSLLLIGFLGGYTTFSSFSIETMNLFENGQLLNGFLYIALSMSLCIMATWMGIILGRQL
jgi:CrcB protein